MASFIIKQYLKQIYLKKRVLTVWILHVILHLFIKGFSYKETWVDLFIYKSLNSLYNSFSAHLNFFFAHHYFLPCQRFKEMRKITASSRFAISYFNFFKRLLAFCSSKYLLPNWLLVIILTMQLLKHALPPKYLHWTQTCNPINLFCCSHPTRAWIYLLIILY